ncbi:MAG: CRTAC1 family protein [Saprospiraceae bacterium]|nr:CRTAC1 family protein [Saprospiraceae bacterium]
MNQIVEKIANLENVKDPKCYATANRLEDFMYGTPLSDEARNLRVEIQKEINLFIRYRASDIATKRGHKEIMKEDVLPILDSLAIVGRTADGDYFYQIDTIKLRIRKIDMDQYSSVAYGYRSILSVEQDLLFIDHQGALPYGVDAMEFVNRFLNLSTLAALRIADITAREKDEHLISEQVMRLSWIKILQGPHSAALFSFQYPTLAESAVGNQVLERIIAQKVDSYNAYNQLSTSVFLRNLQVFFARQKWPVDSIASSQLKNYFLGSLVEFAKQVISQAHGASQERGDKIIRLKDVQISLELFLPFEVNDFEDVIFFPNDEENQITIESYDLDAFRDGGLHWNILKYALDDPDIYKKVIDPTAAELIVEGVAQLGVLVLRESGRISHEAKHSVMMLNDLENGFVRIQELISDYPNHQGEAKTESLRNGDVHDDAVAGNRFEDVTLSSGIAFEQRSSDWLNRLIRSYVYSAEERTAKLSIPPAFGGSGVGVEDVNNDGFMDILLLGGIGNKLYLGDSSGQFTDITSQIPINSWDEQLNSFGEPRQPIIADLDNDGWEDIVITYVNRRHLVLKNIDGEHFEDVSGLANLGGEEMVAGPATALDYDGDGLLDIFIGYFGNYLEGVLPTLSRHNQNGMPNKLFHNLGNFQFEEVTFTRDSMTDNGWTQAVGHTDIDQDGRQDLIVGNDFGVNRYYLNTPDQGFVEKSKEWKTDKPSYTMNVGIGDLNHDQFPDLYISNIVVMQKEEKYVSPNEQTTMKFDPEKMTKIRTVEANDLFLSRLKGKKFNGYELSEDIGRGFSSTGWSWDADFFDYDNDGDEDLYCLNGMNDFRVYSTENPFYYGADSTHKDVEYAASDRERNVFFVNEDGHLVNKATELGTDLYSNSRSASYIDFDRDGDEDIIINNYHDRAYLLRNNLKNPGNWLNIKLIGDPTAGVNLDAVGSSITLDSPSKKGQWREIHSTTGYLSVHPKEQHFGLGPDQKADIMIKWSNGKIVKINNLSSNRNYHIKYPDVLLH